MYPEGSGLQSYVDTVRRDPFLSRIVAMLLLFALLAPVAWLVGRDGSTVVRSRLPGAAAPAEAVVVLPSDPAAAAAAPAAAPTTAPPTSAATVPPADDSASVSPPPAPAAPAAPVATTAKPAPTTATPAPTTAKPPATTAKPPATTAKPAPATAPPTTAPPPTAAPTTAPPTTEAAPPPPPPATTYTREQSMAIIREVWPDELEEKALAIAKRESNFIAEVDNGWCCYGLFQIYFKVNKSFLATQGVTTADQLRDAWVNTRVAYALYQLAGWKPWGG